MNISILGTGIVGRAHAGKLAGLGHNVVVGTRDINKTLANKEKDGMGNPPFREWQASHSGVKLVTLEDATKHGEVIFNALNGEAAVAALKSLEQNLKGKVLVDIANPLDFSRGMPPSLLISNTTSLGEQIQQALPEVKVVKAFNTMNAFLQVDPHQLAGGDHHLFLSGNDEGAKKIVTKIARSYGWKYILDLGDITTARGPEMYLPLWLRIWGALQVPNFNIKVIK